MTFALPMMGIINFLAIGEREAGRAITFYRVPFKNALSLSVCLIIFNVSPSLGPSKTSHGT
jgi:hypothetical protein